MPTEPVVSGEVTVRLVGEREEAAPRVPGVARPPIAEDVTTLVPYLRPGLPTPLTEGQRQQLELAKEAARLQNQALEYYQMFVGERPSLPQMAFMAITDFLPMIVGPLGIGALIAQSKLISTSVMSLAEVLGTFFDVLLLPLWPLVVKIIQGAAGVTTGAIEISRSIREQGVVRTGELVGKGFWAEFQEWLRGEPKPPGTPLLGEAGAKGVPFSPFGFPLLGDVLRVSPFAWIGQLLEELVLKPRADVNAGLGRLLEQLVLKPIFNVSIEARGQADIERIRIQQRDASRLGLEDLGKERRSR